MKSFRTIALALAAAATLSTMAFASTTDSVTVKMKALNGSKEDGTAIVNDVPSKFLEKFETTEQALRELRHLTSFGHMDTELRQTALPAS